MKSRVLIIIGIISVAVFLMGTIVYPTIYNVTFDNSGISHNIQNSLELNQKYQYKFGESTIKNEKNQQFDRVFFSYSHNFGKTFSESQDISMSENTWTAETEMILMEEDVILIWREEIPPVHTLAFAISEDHGENLEKKYLWYGSRPDIIHYDNVLYLTWVDLETRQILYTTSDNKGETFEEHKVIFAPTGEFSPYALKPEPKLTIEDNFVNIIWKSQNQEYEFVIGRDDPLSP